MLPQFQFLPEQEAALRLVVGFALCSLLGLERQYQGQPAGFRTHILVGLGSCLLMMLSAAVGAFYGADPGRIAAQIVTGIGFLGAGAILREGPGVKGLTTAANIWATAAVGMAIGAGWYFGGALATLLMLIVLRVLKPLDVRVVPGACRLLVDLQPGVDFDEVFREALRDMPVKLVSCEWRGSGPDSQSVSIELSAKRRVVSEIGPALLRHPAVRRVRVLD